MNSAQLWKCVKQNNQLLRYCTGIYASDTVPEKISALPTCYIMNTDPISLPGTHWIAVYLSLYGQHEFFDSYGRPQSSVVPNLRQPSAGTWQENRVPLQGPLSITCGQYCLYYLSERCAGRQMNEIVSDFSCTQDQIENDRMINEYINSRYNTQLDIYDEKFIVMQYATAFLK